MTPRGVIGASLQALARANDFTLALFRRLCIVACVIMAVSIFAQVVLRYGFGVGLQWAEELARMMMVGFAFMTAPIIYRRGETIAVSFVAERLPPLARKATAVFVHLLVFACALWFLKLSWDYTIINGMRSRAVSLPIKMVYAYAVMPVSFFVLASVVLQMAAESFCQLLQMRRKQQQ